MQEWLSSLSVIIATYERPLELARLLVDLEAQKDTPPFEVLICDDGSHQQTIRRLQSMCRTFGAKLLTQEDRGFRAASARNMGIRKARHEVAVFLDDDVRILPNFLREHSRIHSQQGHQIALIGPRLNVPELLMTVDTIALEPFIEIEKDDREGKYGLSFKDNRLKKARCPWKVLYTCNASVHLSNLRTIGGFDESFVGYGLEDNELGYRLFKSGVDFLLADQIPVFHEKESDTRDAYKRAIKGIPADFTSYVENAKRFVEKHRADPDVRRVFSQILGTIDGYLQSDDSGWIGYQIQIF